MSACGGLSTALGHRCMQPSALPSHRCVEGQGVEAILDDAEAPNSQRARSVIGGDQDTEVQLGQRDDADCGLLVWSLFAAINTDVSRSVNKTCGVRG
jgi:hypothetical protein